MYLYRMIALLIFVAPIIVLITPSYAGWQRDPCNDIEANVTCKVRNGIRVCGYPGESFRTCGSKYDFSRVQPKKPAIKFLVPEAIEKCKAQAMYDYKSNHEGTPFQYTAFLSLMKGCEISGYRAYLK